MKTYDREKVIAELLDTIGRLRGENDRLVEENESIKDGIEPIRGGGVPEGVNKYAIPGMVKNEAFRRCFLEEMEKQGL